jgi:hypothetical protein
MRRDRSTLSALVLLLALQASPAAAWAQASPGAQPPASSATPPSGSPAQPSSPTSPTPPSPSAQPSDPAGEPPPGGQAGAAPVQPKTADDYALEGRKLALKPGMLPDARNLLLTAWSMKRSYDIAGNLGSIEFELGLMRDAAEHLSFCQQNFPAVRDADQTQKLAVVEQLLKEARAQVGGVRIRVTDPDGLELEGAEVLVDGKVIGRAPLVDEVFVEAGTRMLSARQPGHQEASKTLEAAKGGSESVTLVLPVVVQAPNPKDKVAPPPPGKKRVALIAAGAGLAAVGLGLGVGFTLASNGKTSDAQAVWDELHAQTNPEACKLPSNDALCANLRSAYDSRETLRGVAIGGYIAGGVLALGTAAYALLPSSMLPRALLKHEAPATTGARTSASVSVSVTPSVTLSGGGAVVHGTF